ncbi:MAG: hypothetical protein EOP84_19160, partial [Verrucomicrobiaceae bacterium]
MKTFCPFLAALALLISPALQAAENPYDTLGKVLMPFVNILAEKSRSPDRAVLLNLELEEATETPKELQGARVEISFQAPDKIKIQGPVLGEQ